MGMVDTGATDPMAVTTMRIRVRVNAAGIGSAKIYLWGLTVRVRGLE